MPPGNRRKWHPGARRGPRGQRLRVLPSRAAAQLPRLPGLQHRPVRSLVGLDGQPGDLHDPGRRGAVAALRSAHRGGRGALRRHLLGLLPGAGLVRMRVNREGEPSYAGLTTFGKAPLVLDPADLAVAAAVSPQPVGLVHFDAHADDAAEVHGVVRSHGTPLRLLVEEGSLRGEHIVQVGLRGYWPDPEDFEWARSQGFRWHLIDEVHDRGIDAVTSDVVAALSGLERVFLSVDIDVCDPAFAPGTGTPEPGGMAGWQLLRSVRRLAAELPIAGMEVVEVAPPYDHADVTALLAHRVVLEALGGMALRKLGRGALPERS